MAGGGGEFAKVVLPSPGRWRKICRAHRLLVLEIELEVCVWAIERRRKLDEAAERAIVRNVAA